MLQVKETAAEQIFIQMAHYSLFQVKGRAAAKQIKFFPLTLVLPSSVTNKLQVQVKCNDTPPFVAKIILINCIDQISIQD